MPGNGRPLALARIRPLARRVRNNARPLQMKLQAGVAPAEAMILDQMFVEGLDRETRVALAIEPLHFLRPVGGNPLARRLAEPAIDKSGLALLLVSPRPAAERPLAHPQELRRLFLIEFRRFPAVE